MQKFNAKVYRSGGWLCIDIPVDIQAVYGVRGRMPVAGTINGFSFRSSVFPTGDGKHMMLVNKTMQAKGNIHEGDPVPLEIDRDTAPRKNEVPEDLEKGLKSNPKIKAFFDTMPYSHQKAYINFLVEVKRPETRTRRIEKILKELQDKTKQKP